MKFNLFLKMATVLLFVFLINACSFVHIHRNIQTKKYNNAGVSQRMVKLENATVSFWEGGTGPDLLLLHGFGGDATVAWTEQLPYFAKHFHVIAPDLLWFGESKGKDPATVEDQLQMIKELLAYLDVKKYDVLGISFGGILAFELAASDAKRVQKVVLVATPGSSYLKEDYLNLLERFHVKNLHEILLPPDAKSLARLYKIAYFNPPFKTKLGSSSVLKDLINRNRKEKLTMIDNLVSELNTIHKRRQKFKQGALIIWGEDDPIFPLAIGERLKNNLGDNARLVIIKNARHAPNLEYPALFNKIVSDFLLEQS